jgi:hypothetical protein
MTAVQEDSSSLFSSVISSIYKKSLMFQDAGRSPAIPQKKLQFDQLIKLQQF